jgi:hypothetical protein
MVQVAPPQPAAQRDRRPMFTFASKRDNEPPTIRFCKLASRGSRTLRQELTEVGRQRAAAPRVKFIIGLSQKQKEKNSS